MNVFLLLQYKQVEQVVVVVVHLKVGLVKSHVYKLSSIILI